jgi:preprotein translocase subunit SecB
MSTPEAPTAAPEQQPGIMITQVFLDRLSFEHRAEPLSLPAGGPANVGILDVRVEMGMGGEGNALGFTRVTVSTRPDQEPVYNIALTITGLFARQSDEAMPLEDFLKNNSVALLYPFVRETFANVTQRGRFGPVWLNPLNTRAGWRLAPTAEQPARGSVESSSNAKNG